MAPLFGSLANGHLLYSPGKGSKLYSESFSWIADGLFILEFSEWIEYPFSPSLPWPQERAPTGRPEINMSTVQINYWNKSTVHTYNKYTHILLYIVLMMKYHAMQLNRNNKCNKYNKYSVIWKHLDYFLLY